MYNGRIRFAIIGFDHTHAHNHVKMHLDAGAKFAAYFTDRQELRAEAADRYPEIRAAETMEEILEDSTIDIVAGAAMPADRAGISIQAMQHGKDVVADKPVVTSLAELDEIERVQRETGRIWCLYSNEHHDRRCTVLAGELVRQGAIGQVFQTTGFGPHTLHPSRRPSWFWNKATSGGIIGDIGAHQIEQFLFFTDSQSASIVQSRTGDFSNHDHPDFEDYGEVSIEGDGGIGWFRVDWCSPESLGVAGDVRLFLLGTEGYMEMRKYVDPAGRPGGEHLLLVNSEGARFVETGNVQLTFGARLLDDVRNRTETATLQKHSFLVTRLAMEASLSAKHIFPTPV